MEFFWNFFWNFSGGFFWRNIFGRIFSEDFLEGFFLGGIFCLHWNWRVCQDFDLMQRANQIIRSALWYFSLLVKANLNAQSVLLFFGKPIRCIYYFPKYLPLIKFLLNFCLPDWKFIDWEIGTYINYHFGLINIKRVFIWLCFSLKKVTHFYLIFTGKEQTSNMKVIVQC